MRSIAAALTLVVLAALGAAASASVEVDDPHDPRIRLAVARLREAIREPGADQYDYAVGARSARAALPMLDLAGLGPEGFILRTVRRPGARPCVVIAGEGAQGTAYGVFRLARILRSAPERLARLNVRMRPYFPVREVYEEHFWADPAQIPRYRRLLERYLEESVNTLDMPVGWYHSPPHYLVGPSTKPAEDFATVHQVIAYAHSLGIRVHLVEDAYLNPLYNEKPENLRGIDRTALERMRMSTGPDGASDPLLLCLADPLARDVLRRNREIIYREFHDADGIVVYFGDPGGCSHPGCMPHGKKAVEYLHQIYAPLVKAVNPALRMVPTLWGLSLEDVEYFLAHLDDLPPFVTGLQVPPTSMVQGRYMVFEPRRGELIKAAAQRLPVTIQQFWDGVGYRDAWVDTWEHPMPREMARNLRGSLPSDWRRAAPGARPVGVYGSSFELDHQLVDLRLTTEWGWDPGRSSDDILREFGDEQFGRGVGAAFSRAMHAMEAYWAAEARRFHSDTGDLTDAATRTVRRSLASARTALRLLRGSESRVVRGADPHRAAIELADMMVNTSELVLLREDARRLLSRGEGARAARAAEDARDRANRVVALITNSQRYAFLTKHPWWSVWDIGTRAARLADLADDARHPDRWKVVALEDPSFEHGRWETAGGGKTHFAGPPRTGQAAARLTTGTDGEWCLVHPSRYITVRPGARYQVEFWTRANTAGARLYVDMVVGERDSPNTDVYLAGDDRWHRHRVEVRTPEVNEPTEMALRFVALGAKQSLVLDDVTLWERPATPDGGASAPPAPGDEEELP